MDRSFYSGASGSPPSYPGSPSVGSPTKGNAGMSIPATLPGEWWYHMVTEELRGVVAAVGLTPSGASITQLLTALRSGALNAVAVGGTADALTATFSTPFTALTAGMPFWVRAAYANATTTPTLNISGLGARTIVKGNGMALAAGDISGAGHWLQVSYDATLNQMVLANPATGVSAKTQINQVLLASGTTWTTPAGITSNTVFKITLVGGGGGGGGVGGSTYGGGAGGAAIWYASGLTPSTGYTYAIGAGGTGGTTAPTSGTAGGNTSITLGGTTVTGSGGGIGASGVAAMNTGGAGGAVTNGTLQIPGQPGGMGFAYASITMGGAGGSTLFGGGGVNAYLGYTIAGRGYGAGGAGGNYYMNGSAAQAGGAGMQGAILIEWSN